jgi:hypothetical protein
MRYLILTIVLSMPHTVFAAEPASISLLSKPDAFETLVNPQCSHCNIEAQRRSKELRDDDRVLCWIRGYSDGGAIPVRFFLNTYRVISDSYGVFVYDPDAGFARGFAPSYDFKFHGWRNGILIIKHKDGTLYSALTGRAFEGPNAGKKLAPVPTLVSNWGDWLGRYPNTVAYEMFDKYQPTELPKDTLDASRQTRGPVDSRLAEDALVLGVANGDRARAYRMSDLARSGLINEKIGDNNWAILWNPATKTAAAYLSVAHPPDKADKGLRPRPIKLRLPSSESKAPFVDEETKSHWDIAGRAIEGELKDWTLQWLDGTQVKWFAWAAEYPTTTIYNVAE